MPDSPTAIVTTIVAVLAFLLGGANFLHQHRTADRQQGQVQSIADRQHEQVTSMAYRTELQDEVTERREQTRELRSELVILKADLVTCRGLFNACEARSAQMQSTHDQTVYELRAQIATLNKRIVDLETGSSS